MFYSHLVRALSVVDVIELSLLLDFCTCPAHLCSSVSISLDSCSSPTERSPRSGTFSPLSPASPAEQQPWGSPCHSPSPRGGPRSPPIQNGYTKEVERGSDTLTLTRSHTQTHLKATSHGGFNRKNCCSTLLFHGESTCVADGRRYILSRTVIG